MGTFTDWTAPDDTQHHRSNAANQHHEGDRVSHERSALISQISDAAGKLADTVGKLGDGDMAEPTPNCPGWTRGHVITHVARSADTYWTTPTSPPNRYCCVASSNWNCTTST